MLILWVVVWLIDSICCCIVVLFGLFGWLVVVV